jgi:Ca2+-binding RTX toxin-like protein
VSGTHNLFGKNSEGQGTGGQVAMAVRDGEILAAIGDTSTNFSVHGGTVAAGASTQAVLTFGAEGMQLYVNGEEVDTNSHTGGLDGNFEPLVIGAESGFSTPGTVDDLQRFFQGAIDEFAVYDRALTGDEIRALFEAGQLGGRLVGTAAADTLIGGSDAEDLRGAGGNDLIRGNGDDDDLLGGGGADRLLGGTGNDHLSGGGGKDTLSGGGGADELFGGRGVDIMRGGAGDDLLNGGPGRDRLAGGAGGDTFQIDRISHGVDRIRGFEDGAGGDILDLGAVLDFGDGDDIDGFVRLVEVSGNSTIEVDANGGGDNFTAVFNLLGVTGLDLATLVADGNVQPGPPLAS